MTLSLTVGDRDVILSDEVVDRSIRSKTSNDGSQGVLDFSLINPASVPANHEWVVLSDDTGLLYEGEVRSVYLRQYESTLFVDVACQNDDAGGDLPTAAPYGLSDNPDGLTTIGFRSMTMRRESTSGEEQTQGTAIIFTPGFEPGMNVDVTNGNYSLTAEEFNIKQVSIEWPLHDDPVYTLDFGDAVVRLSTIVTEVPDGSITTTKISDGAITTPKIAANAVTATEIAAGAITTSELNASAVIQLVTNSGATVVIDASGITIEDGALTFLDDYGTTALTGSGFGDTWQRFIQAGLYNSDFHAEPPTPASNINDTTNVVPFWPFTKASGTAINAQIEDDGATASGHIIQFSMAAGSAGDSSYIQQIAPVVGSYGRLLHYVAAAAFHRDVDGLAQAWIELQYLDSGLATTGSSAVNTKTLTEINAEADDVYRLSVGASIVPPADAQYVRIRAGMQRGSATTGTTATVDLADVALYAYPLRGLYIPDTDDGTINPSRLHKQDGRAFLSSANASTYLYVDDNDVEVGIVADRFELQADTIFRVVGGTSFPGSPQTQDRFWRTDYNAEFVYTGTRWQTVQLFCATSSQDANSATFFIYTSVDRNRMQIANLVPPFGTDVLIVSITHPVLVQSGGSALSGSHGWDLDYYKGTAAAPTTFIAGIDIDSGSSNVFRSESVAVNALLGLANPVISVDVSKTGTPGDLAAYIPFNVFYRIVAT